QVRRSWWASAPGRDRRRSGVPALATDSPPDRRPARVHLAAPRPVLRETTRHRAPALPVLARQDRPSRGRTAGRAPLQGTAAPGRTDQAARTGRAARTDQARTGRGART